jgi:hypothetical protein
MKDIERYQSKPHMDDEGKDRLAEKIFEVIKSLYEANEALDFNLLKSVSVEVERAFVRRHAMTMERGARLHSLIPLATSKYNQRKSISPVKRGSMHFPDLQALNLKNSGRLNDGSISQSIDESPANRSPVAHQTPIDPLTDSEDFKIPGFQGFGRVNHVLLCNDPPQSLRIAGDFLGVLVDSKRKMNKFEVGSCRTLA